MQTTPLETKELLEYLKEEGRINDKLVKDLKATIKRYRLDQDLIHHKKSLIRRTYTCPFFKDQNMGCSIAPEAKPYGCLGFNAKSPAVKDGENCGSDIELLERRELLHIELESVENQKIKAELEIHWDKQPMPVALVELIEKLNYC